MSGNTHSAGTPEALASWQKPLHGGLALYGAGAALMVIALRHGELSVLYPLISLSYVWVAVLSVVVFGEIMNVYKVTGICAIMAGVAVLGSGAHK